MRSPPLRPLSRIVPEECCILYKSPTFTMKSAVSCTVIPYSREIRYFDAQEPILLTKNISTIWRKMIFNCKSSFSIVKLFSFTNYRGLSTEVFPEELQTAKLRTHDISKAQAALMDYLHNTRGLEFSDAEHISKHSPIFVSKILEKVQNEEDIDRALRKFFRYKPINEFEPFFESIGLKPSEFSMFLPRDLIFIRDDEKLINSYRYLCNYGIARGKIGKMYQEAAEIFGYDFGVLETKLQAYEALGFSQSSVIKLVCSSPVLLVGSVIEAFSKVIEALDQMSIKRDWIGGVLSEKNSYNWNSMLVILNFLMEIGFTKQELGALIKKKPEFLLDGSGNVMFSLVGLLLKSGATKGTLLNLLSRFPSIQIGVFRRNFWRGLLFLTEIKMDAEDIQEIMQSHAQLLGSCRLKKTSSILYCLHSGKKRLCKIIKEDPSQLKKYTFGLRVNRLPSFAYHEQSRKEKTNFLLRLGFTKDSKELEKALKNFRGKGEELQERYDFLVKTGFHPNDVSNMIKMAPNVLNQKTSVLESKISFLVNNLGYPLSSLVAFPICMSCTIKKVNLRVSMYRWLKDKGKTPALSLSTILTCSENVFLKRYVNLDPEGPVVWETLKKEFSSD